MTKTYKLNEKSLPELPSCNGK